MLTWSEKTSTFLQQTNRASARRELSAENCERKQKLKYSVGIGNAREDEVRNTARIAGYKYDKVPVVFVDNKEEDTAIADLKDPQILIMLSCQIPTLLYQIDKANEQSRMYDDVRKRNNSRARIE